MKIKCDYCGNYMDGSDEKCSKCGSINHNLEKNLNQPPKTIEELRKWYIDKNLPNENITRFFIGKNYQEPKAFGIYRDEKSQTFIVYKNKADGNRAIRYQGNDEAYAVNELYLRLKEEIINQKNHSINNSNYKNINSFDSSKYQQDLENYRKSKHENFQREKKGISKKLLFFIFFIIAIPNVLPIIVTLFILLFCPHRGYYNYYGNYYYYQYPCWYIYNNYYGWDYTTVPDELKKHSSDYYESSQYDYGYNISNFENSKFYIEPSDSSSSDGSWDSDSSWDSGSSWDSSSTDWDSDW